MGCSYSAPCAVTVGLAFLLNSIQGESHRTECCPPRIDCVKSLVWHTDGGVYRQLKVRMLPVFPNSQVKSIPSSYRMVRPTISLVCLRAETTTDGKPSVLKGIALGRPLTSGASKPKRGPWGLSPTTLLTLDCSIVWMHWTRMWFLTSLSSWRKVSVAFRLRNHRLIMVYLCWNLEHTE